MTSDFGWLILNSDFRKGNEMKLSRVRRSTVSIAAVLLLTPICGAQDDKYSRPSLWGLPAMMVTIEPLSDEAKRAGLNEQDIQTDVELKLRLGGVKLVTLREGATTPGTPFCNVYVGLMLGDSSTYVYLIKVSVTQQVLLIRDPTIRTMADTWSVEHFGIVGKNNLRQLRGAIKDQIDIFLNAYLSVNPKK